MKKRILQCLVILAINLVVDGLVFTSFMLFFLRGDPVLAALPAIVALPAILVQPWFLLFFFLPKGIILAPFLTTAVTVPLYILLDEKGMLDRAKRFLFRFKKRNSMIIGGTFLICLFTIGYTRHIDFPAMFRGVPRSLQPYTKDLDLSLVKPRYYCLSRFLDSRWLWKASLPEQELNLLADKLNMQPLPSNQIDASFYEMPPYWWRPEVSDEVRILATPDFPMRGRGPDGLHALAAWNPEDESIHMWIIDNF